MLADSDVRVLGSSEAIAAVRDIEVLADGSVWILNSVEPLVVGFGPEGNVLRAFGRQGDGPDEFGAPAGFVVGDIDGEAWVFDRRRHALVRVSGSRTTDAVRSLRHDSLPSGAVVGGMNLLSEAVRTARAGRSLVLPRRSAEGETDIMGFWRSTWAADLVALDLDTGSLGTVVELRSALGDPTPHFDLTGVPLPIPLWFRLWAVCADSEIRVYDRLRNELRGFALDGSEVEPIALPSPRYDEVSAGHFASIAFDAVLVESMGEVGMMRPALTGADSARIMAEVMTRVEAEPVRLAEVLPRYVDYRCDEEGTQWIQPLDLDDHGGFWNGLAGSRVWLRIAPDGEIHTVRLPERFDPYRFTPAKIWGIRRDELDVASVAWIDLPPRPSR